MRYALAVVLGLFLVGAAQAQPVMLVNATYNNCDAPDCHCITPLPSGSAGDVIIMTIDAEIDPGGPTVGTWTQIPTYAVFVGQTVWWHIYGYDGTEPSSYTTMDAENSQGCILADFTNENQSNPIRTSNYGAGSNSPAVGPSLIADVGDMLVNYDVIINGISGQNGKVNITAPAGMSTIQNPGQFGDGTGGGGLFDLSIVTAGATGTQSAALEANQLWQAGSWIIEAALPVPTPTATSTATFAGHSGIL